MLKFTYFRRILGFIILIAAVATITIIIHYFINSAKNEKKAHSRSLSTDISMKTIHLTESQQNEKKWELFAQHGSYDKLNEKTSLEDLRFIVARNPKDGPVTATAQHGEYLHKPKTVHLQGNVIIRTNDGMTFDAPEINYDSTRQTFSTKTRIKLTDAALTVEGVGMELLVDKQRSIIKNQVEATVYPGKRQK